MKHAKHSRPKRFTGAGKALDSPPKSMEKTLRGQTDRQAAVNRSTPCDPEGPYHGNVTGPYSKPVSLGGK